MGNRRNRGRRSGSENQAPQGPPRMEQLFGGFIDRFTDVDEILRDLDATVEKMDDNVRSLVTALDDQTALDIEVTQSPPAERPYNFSEVVDADTPANDPITETWSIPHDGTVTKMIIGWPDGSQQTAGVGVVGTQGESLIPAGPRGSNYIALNDKTLTFNLDDDVSKGEEYEFRFANTDTEQDHYVNVIPVLSRGE